MPDTQGAGDQHARDGEELVVVVGVGGRRIGLRARDVREVHPLVLVSPLPDAPDVVEGVVDARGEVVPVLDLGPRLGGPPARTDLRDLLVLLQTTRRTVALHVGPGVDVRTVPVRDLEGAADGLVGAAAGVVVLPDELVLLQDVERFLYAGEEHDLATALARHLDGSP